MHIVFLPKLFPTQMLPDYTLPYILLSSLKNLTWRWSQGICIHREAGSLRDFDGHPGLRRTAEMCYLSVYALCQQRSWQIRTGWIERTNEEINEVGEEKMHFKMR